MSIFGIFVLSTAIGVGVSRGPASMQVDAYRALSKATYIQTGTDDRVKEVEKRLTPKIVKEYGGWIAGIVKMSNDKKISFEWTF